MNERFRLRIKLPWGEEQLVPIAAEQLCLGRDPDCDVEIDDPEVSRRHAQITCRSEDKIILNDLESTNGTFMNGKPVTADMVLSPGSSFVIGETLITFESTVDESFNIVHVPPELAEYQYPSTIQEYPAGETGTVPGRFFQMVTDVLTGNAGIDNLNPMVAHIADILNAENGFMVLNDADGWKQHGLRIKRGKTIHLPIEILKMCMSKNLVARITTAEPDSPAELRTRGIGSILCSPLTVQDKTLGCIFLDRGRKRKPFNPDEAVLLSRLSHLAALTIGQELRMGDLQSEMDVLKWELKRFTAIARTSTDVSMQSKNRKYQQLLFKISRVAGTLRPVLLIGPRGSGRMNLARRIHDSSPRKEQAFIVLDCEAIPPDLLEDELFGCPAQSGFTGYRKPCLLETADQGTLYIHEISALSNPLQQRLAKVIREKQFLRTRDHLTRSCDTRLLVSTDVDVSKVPGSSVFHPDFFELTAGSILDVPSLKQRPEDIIPLSNNLLRLHIPKTKRLPDFTPESTQLLMQYPWPGNINELSAAMRYVALTCRDQNVEVGDLPRIIRENTALQLDSTEPLRKQMDRLEIEIIRRALQRNNLIVTRAAEELGMSESTLRYRMHRLKIPTEKNK
ncbi:sigma 54-interacting transcriptional regulator [bacterium]|nr:sigma 54-interacting transcriptional regulator [candidate division CSSED10-310 bacterium]